MALSYISRPNSDFLPGIRFVIQHEKIIGKKVRGATYIHRSALDHLDPLNSQLVQQALLIMPSEFNDYSIVKIEKEGTVSFIKSPDFDSSPEPMIGDSLKINKYGIVKITRCGRKSTQVYHHKWQMVAPNYQGFDIVESKLRSAIWKSLHLNKKDLLKIGYRDYWNLQIVPLIDQLSDELMQRWLIYFSPKIDWNPTENGKTQSSITRNTYLRIKQLFSQFDLDRWRCLDFGAGKGHGASILGADSLEPLPKDWIPTYTNSLQISNQSYDIVVCMYVLNVVPLFNRIEIVNEIFRILKPGGFAIFLTRSNDVNEARAKVRISSRELITSTGTYQRGFTSKELQNFIGFTGKGEFEIIPTSLGTCGVMAFKKPLVNLSIYNFYRYASMIANEELRTRNVA